MSATRLVEGREGMEQGVTTTSCVALGERLSKRSFVAASLATLDEVLVTFIVTCLRGHHYC